MNRATDHIDQGFKYYVEAEDPDILVLTETKVCLVKARLTDLALLCF